jgi:hypothetical protein
MTHHLSAEELQKLRKANELLTEVTVPHTVECHCILCKARAFTCPATQHVYCCDIDEPEKCDCD